jgi:hypothetical protein
MAFPPRYSIVPCCPDLGTPTASFQIPGGPVPNGVYVYNGPTLPPDSGVTFQTGYCYTIIDLGTYPPGIPIAPNFSNFSPVVDCFDGRCIACAIAPPYAFQVYACCDTETTITLNISGAVLGMDSTVNQYIGTIPFEVNGFIFVPGECYHFTLVGSSQEPDGPTIDNFVQTGDFCETAVGCPTCPPAPQYLRFVSCCDNTTIYLRPDDNSTYLPGVYEYLGTPTVGLENICYSVTLYSVGVAPINNIGDYGALPEAPAFIENVTFNTLSNTNTNCDNYILECPSCTPTCYTLYNCDGIFRNTTVDMSAYVGTFVSISNVDGPMEGTWYVLINTGNCNNAIEDITVDPTVPEPCDCRCFEVTGVTNSLTYIDCEGNFIKTTGPAKFCSLVYPFVTGTPGQYQITEGGNCIDGVCPILCYKLTNCATREIIYSVLQSLSQYVITNSIVTLSGYEGCWEVDTLGEGEICDCPVNVIVLQVFPDCPSCLPIIAYKLTSCENPSDIKYTYDDLSQYINQVVKSDCGCYLVELINYQPPSVTTLIIVTSFDTCLECLRPYYILEDCNGIEDPIYTYTDVSAYFGKIIKIEGCDVCLTVKETDFPINPSLVTVSDVFEDCPSCAPELPCLCSRITNYSTASKNYEYTDCNDETVTFTLQANKSSDKLCVQSWQLNHPDTDNLEVFGECIAPVKFNWICPIIVPVKKVKPGYSVPSCDIEKYEKITCRSAEIYYKQVMRLRYGISNCCPEDEEKWLIKKELIDLAALIDPDYTCVPVTTCCSQPISSCGCGCNQPLKTCNS